MPDRSKFLFDENIGRSVAEHFIAREYDVLAVVLRGDLRGSSDEALLRRAVEEDRVLVTYDTDFAELVFHSGAPHRGVVLLRLHSATPHHTIEVLEKVLDEIANIPPAKFLTVSDTNVRVR